MKITVEGNDCFRTVAPDVVDLQSDPKTRRSGSHQGVKSLWSCSFEDWGQLKNNRRDRGLWSLKAAVRTSQCSTEKKLEPKQTQTLGTQLLGPNTPWYYDFLFSCGGEGIGGDWWSGDPLALVHWVSSCWKEIEDEEYVAGRLWLVTVWLTRQGSTVYSAVFVWLKFPCCAEVWCLLKSLWNEWKSSPSETHWH